MDKHKLIQLVNRCYLGYPDAGKELGKHYGFLYDVVTEGLVAEASAEHCNNKVDELESTVMDLEDEIGQLERAILTLEEELADAYRELNAARDELNQVEIDR